jgi:hypothetical protein
MMSLRRLSDRFCMSVCCPSHNMKPAPSYVGGARVVAHTPIDHRYKLTGRTRHIVDGRQAVPVAALAICQYEGDEDFYLFGCDEEWNIVTDTCHQTLASAKHQADFEYAGASGTWDPAV